MNKPKIILAGGSGFLGRSLAAMLSEHGYDVIILTRSPSPQSNGEIQEIHWDGKSARGWVSCIDGAVAVVNLTGKNVSCRYTPDNRREIVESRTDSVRALAAAIDRCERPPKVWVQTGSLAIYGDAGDRWCDEGAPAGKGFPVETCLLWEREFNTAQLPSTRRVLLRIGFALGITGGALTLLRMLTRWFLGGAMGSGQQYISWIHIADLNRMFLLAIEGENLCGVFNATGPNPVTNAGFMVELRRAMGRPWNPRVPEWAAHFGCWFLRTEACLALTGRRCTPKRFLGEGFEFQFPDLRLALGDLLHSEVNRRKQ